MTPSDQIEVRISELGDWRGEMLGRLRALVKHADPEHDGTYKNHVKVDEAAVALNERNANRR